MHTFIILSMERWRDLERGCWLWPHALIALCTQIKIMRYSLLAWWMWFTRWYKVWGMHGLLTSLLRCVMSFKTLSWCKKERRGLHTHLCCSVGNTFPLILVHVVYQMIQGVRYVWATYIISHMYHDFHNFIIVQKSRKRIAYPFVL